MRARWLSWMLMGVVSACVPQPNGDGRVQCGEGSLCPANFACRFGRCCPQGAPLSACPTQTELMTADDTGALECDSEGRCPSAFNYECRQGRYCCPRDANPATGPCSRGAIGSPCNAMTMCQTPVAGADAGGGVCKDSVSAAFVFNIRLPNGYCSASCSTADLSSCGATGVCIDLVPDKVCVARCRVPEGQAFGPCRNEPAGPTGLYVCLPLAPGDPSSREGYCFPDCMVTGCAFGSTCSASSRRCEERCTAATNCGIGRICNMTAGVCEPSDCRTNTTCSAGQLCNPSTGRCAVDCRIRPITCGLGQRCNQSTGLCQ